MFINAAASTIKLVLAEISFYDRETLKTEVLKVSSAPYAGYQPIISSIQPFTVSVLSTGANNGFGGVTILNHNGELDYLICDRDNRYVFNRRPIKLTIVAHSDEDVDQTNYYGTVLDLTTDSDASISIRYTDPMVEFDQPVVVMEPTESIPETEHYRPYTLNHLYNFFHNVTTGIPADNPRYSEKDTVIPFVLGDVFNYKPISLDYIKSETRDSKEYYYLIYPPTLGTLSVSVFNVKDTGVKLPKKTDTSEGWEIIDNYLIKISDLVFSTLTIDAKIGPADVKGCLSYLINDSSVGGLTKSASISLSGSKLGTAGEASVGYVGSCSDSIISIINQICDSVSLSLYCATPTSIKTYMHKIPPRSDTGEPDPLAESVSFFNNAGITHDWGQPARISGNLANVGGLEAFSNSGGVSEINLNGTDYLYFNGGYCYQGLTDMAFHPAACMQKDSSSLSEDFSVELLLYTPLADLASSTMLGDLKWMPIMEVVSSNYSTTTSDNYVQRTSDNSASLIYSNLRQCDVAFGIVNEGGTFYYAITNGNTGLYKKIINVPNEEKYVYLQKSGNTYYASVGNAVQQTTTSNAPNSAFNQLVVGGGYCVSPCISLGTIGSINDTSFMSDYGTPPSAYLKYTLKPLTMHGYIRHLRLTNGARYGAGEVVDTIPTDLSANNSAPVKAVISYGDIVKGSFKLTKLNVPTKASVYLGFAKNWAAGEDLAGQFDEFPSWKESLSKEYYEVYYSNKQLMTEYKFSPVSYKDFVGTLLVNSADAELEALKRLERISYRSMELVMQLRPEEDYTALKIGDLIKLRHHRYGINNDVDGRLGYVVGMSVDILNNITTLAVLI